MTNNKDKIVVSILCLAYNHEAYIRQCLDGFVMQKTTFRFEAIVHDDASTDGTANIIREYAEKYPSIIKPIFETENQYSKGGGALQKIMDDNTHGKYIAICEGDDYWIDTLKLQKQVELLERDDSVGLVYAKAKKVDNRTGKVIEVIGLPFETIDDLLFKNRIPTLTACYRKDLYDLYKKTIVENMKEVGLGDYTMWPFFKLNSKVVFVNEICAVYRVLEESAAHSKSIDKMIRFHTDIYNISMFYANNFPDSLKDRKKTLFKIEDRYEWSKYRVYQAESFPKRYILSNTILKKLSIRHRLIYLLNKYVLKLGHSL